LGHKIGYLQDSFQEQKFNDNVKLSHEMDLEMGAANCFGHTNTDLGCPASLGGTIL
jgi:hypothetical protein